MPAFIYSLKKKKEEKHKCGGNVLPSSPDFPQPTHSGVQPVVFQSRFQPSTLQAQT